MIERKRSSSPKFQVHNNALLSSQNPYSFNIISENPGEWGRIITGIPWEEFLRINPVGLF